MTRIKLALMKIIYRLKLALAAIKGSYHGIIVHVLKENRSLIYSLARSREDLSKMIAIDLYTQVAYLLTMYLNVVCNVPIEDAKKIAKQVAFSTLLSLAAAGHSVLRDLKLDTEAVKEAVKSYIV